MSVWSRVRGRVTCLDFFAETCASEPTAWADRIAAVLSVVAQRRRERNLVIVLPSSEVLGKHSTVPKLGAFRRGRMLRFEAEQVLPAALEEVVWAATPSGKRGREIDMLFAAAKREVVEALCIAAEGKGFAVRAVIPAFQALLAASESGEQAGLWIHVAGNAACCFQRDAGRYAVRVIPRGVREEETKTDVLWLAAEILRSTLHFQQRLGLGEPRVARVMAFPGQMQAIEKALADKLRIPVEPWSGSGDCDGREEVPDGVVAEQRVLAAGAARLVLEDHSLLDLRPEAWRRTERVERVSRGVMTGGLVVIAALLLGGWQWARAGDGARARIEAVASTIAPLRANEAQRLAAEEHLRAQEETIAHHRALRAQREAWPRFLADLERRVVASGAWLGQCEPVGAVALRQVRVAGWLPMGPQNGADEVARTAALRDEVAASPLVESLTVERFTPAEKGRMRFQFLLTSKVKLEVEK